MSYVEVIHALNIFSMFSSEMIMIDKGRKNPEEGKKVREGGKK